MFEPIIHQEIDGQKSVCIIVGSSDVKLSGNLMQGKKLQAAIWKDGALEWLDWNGIAIIDGMQVLSFPDMDLRPVSAMARDGAHALARIRSLAEMLSLLPSEFLHLESGILPLWRIYEIHEEGWLVLPQALGSLVEASLRDMDRFELFNAYVHYDIHPNFSLIDEMAQLLYTAVTRKPPYLDHATREDHCNAIPLSFMHTNVPKETCDFIDRVLHMGLTSQRDIAGNKEPQRVLVWFLDQTKDLSWPMGGVVTEMIQAESTRFFKGQLRRANRRVFWRKKGWLVLLVSAVVLCAAGFTGSKIKQKLTPPYTYGMSDERIITEYYAGQSALDVQKMDASLAPHVHSPADLEVTNLYVNRQTREAYEHVRTIIDVNEWLADGKPPVPETGGVYGVTDVAIEQVDADTYRVDSTIWTPFAYDEEDEGRPVEAGTARAFIYRQHQVFTFTTNKRGWRLIASITNTGYEKIGEETLKTRPIRTGAQAAAANSAMNPGTPTT